LDNVLSADPDIAGKVELVGHVDDTITGNFIVKVEETGEILYMRPKGRCEAITKTECLVVLDEIKELRL